MEKAQGKKKKGSIYRNFLELIAVGSITGVFAGTVVTFFNILVHEGEKISRGVYAYVRANPAFLPLFFLALLTGAFLLSVCMSVASVVRGVGIPQAEGAMRGIVPLKWWRDLVFMFTSCLLSVFMGLSIGAEGPSVLIGACAGDGVSVTCKRNQMIRRYQVTGGACAGLAVASNAPLTGIAFAFEEAHKRFTPEVFICAFSSVIFGILSRSVIYRLLGMQVVNSFGSYDFHALPASGYFFVVVAGVICGVLGVLFYKGCFKMRRVFKKVQFRKARNRYLARVAVAVLLGGIVSLIAVGVMGGGHDLIESLGTYGGQKAASIQPILGKSIVWALVIIVLLRLFITTVNVGSGIPCGIFIPIIAIGACVGALLNEAWTQLGMDKKYCDIMIMICMAAFFTTVVKAPITSIVMICEFTGSFAPLLPVIIAVFIGYVIGEMAKTDGIYEELLEHYENETGIHHRAVQEVFVLKVVAHALADKCEVRDVLWPSGTRVTGIKRGEEMILPEGETVLLAGDELSIVCKTLNPKATKDELMHIVGEHEE